MQTSFLRGAAALLLLGLPRLGLSQSVGIGTSTPDAKAALDIQATDRGLLVPRLTAAQRGAIASPPQGLMVYQTDGSASGGPQTGFWYFAGQPAAWVFLNPAGGAGDNLGNGIATTNVNLQSFALTGSGADLGTAVGLGVRADGGLNLGQNSAGSFFSGNFFVGYQAGASTTPRPGGPLSNSEGVLNQFVGYRSGTANTTGRNNQFSGYLSGAANTTGSNNQFSGLLSGYANTTGSNNQFVGSLSGYANTTGRNNQFNGYLSGYSNTTGSSNQFVGYQSGTANTTGDNNQFVGYQSGTANTTGVNNQFSGYQSGYSNTTGVNNQFSGYQSGYSNTTGDSNQFSGYQSGYNNTTGFANCFIGNQSGTSNATGNYNTALGSFSGQFTNVGNLNNTIALGYLAVVGTSNTIQLGNAAITSFRCQVGLTITSDARFKTDVRADVPGLAFIKRLRPVTYRLDAARQRAFERPGALAACGAPDPADPTRHTGFLAQDVERVTQELGFDFDGLHRPAHARDPYGLNYAQFVVPLVRAVQELSAENAALQAKAAADHADLQTLQAQLARLLGEAPTIQVRR